MFDIGVIATVGFLGAAFATRARLPVVIGYIIAGILIGPNIHLRILGWSYDGVLQDSAFLQNISQLGLVLLLFFVGLEFSITKLMKTKEAAAILAVTNLAVNMFAGFVIGAWLGWPLIDTIFMAGVISMSSSAITAKSLIDLKRLGNEESILYATVGARAIRANDQLPNDYAGRYLTPFAGILCIVMSSLAPILMTQSTRIADFFTRRLPKSITFGAELVKRTLKTVIMPNFLPIYRRKRLVQASIILYAAWIIDLTVTTGMAHLAMSIFTPVLVFAVWASTRHAFRDPVRHTNYGVDTGPFGRSAIEAFVLRIVVGALAVVGLVAIVWQYYWPSTLVILYTYFLVVIFSMKVVYRRLGLGVGRRPVPIRLVRHMPPARSWRAASGRR